MAASARTAVMLSPTAVCSAKSTGRSGREVLDEQADAEHAEQLRHEPRHQDFIGIAASEAGLYHDERDRRPGDEEPDELRHKGRDGLHGLSFAAVMHLRCALVQAEPHFLASRTRPFAVNPAARMDAAIERLCLGRMQNPVRGFLHGSAAVLSMVGAAVLWREAHGDLGMQVALVVFAASLVALYTVSSLYHSFPWQAVWKQRMQRLDHSMIFVVVAGTYTPIAMVVLDGPLLIVALAATWGITVAGIIQKIFWPHVGALGVDHDADGAGLARAAVPRHRRADAAAGGVLARRARRGSRTRSA
jgi:hypothetical protein